MQRPDSDPLEEIEAILKDLEETENALQTLRERLDQAVRNLGQKLPEREKLIEVATYLYWMIPEVRSEPLALAITGEPKVHLIKRHIPAVTAGIHCDRCRVPIQFNSRSKLHDTIRDLRRLAKRGGGRWAEGYRIVCQKCETEIMADRQRQYVEERNA